MDTLETALAEAAQLIRLGKAKESLTLVDETLASHVRHLALVAGAERELAGGDPNRLATITPVEFIDFLVERGVLRHRQKADMREIHRQVTVAKREHVGPTLEQANRALRFAREFIDRCETAARDLMRSPVLGIDRDKLIEDAVTLMRSRGVRQLPVIEKGRPARALTPETILRLVDEGVSDLACTPVWDVADRGLPKVSPEAKLPELLRLLRTNPAVLVVEGDKTVGLVTASDVLQVVRRYR